MEKFASRKFLMALAAFLASLGTGIAGLCTNNEAVAMAGGILCVISAAIYAFCEAYVDGASVKASTSEYVESVQVQSSKGDQLTQAAAAKLVANTPVASVTPAEGASEPKSE